jgi:hypothetical protein
MKYNSTTSPHNIVEKHKNGNFTAKHVSKQALQRLHYDTAFVYSKKEEDSN